MVPQNFKVTMETDELQRRIAELCDINADLQVAFTANIFCFHNYLISAPLTYCFPTWPCFFLDYICFSFFKKKPFSLNFCFSRAKTAFFLYYVTALSLSSDADSLI